jgi:DNA-binding transcriptional regulator YdaS (Cro superfamily)
MGSDRAKVAKRLGIGRTYLDRLCRGERRPSLELAAEIERLSSGEVTAADLAKLPPHVGD